MEGKCLHILEGQRLWLLPEKCIFWENAQMLIVSDAHVGKAGHFRKEGIALPAGAGGGTRERLGTLLTEYAPKTLLFLGDLFHSGWNSETDGFTCWLLQQPVKPLLVPGNHDRHSAKSWAGPLEATAPEHRSGPFVFTHEPMATPPPGGGYNLCGHIHPAVDMSGLGRQRLRLPCFWFGRWQAVLPAFGVFTGSAKVLPKPGDSVFAVAGSKVVQVGG